MPTANVERKLAAILSADVKDYSRLMGEDEVGTIHTLTACREITDSCIAQHHGRVVNTAGDSVLAEFASAVDAVQCAVEIQHALKAKNADLPPERKMEFRLGLNVGDVVVEGEQLYGDGVNVAARLQALADAGGIFVSGTVYDQIENKLVLNYEYLGEQAVKNISKPVRVWRVVMDEAAAALAATQAALGHTSPETQRGGTAPRAHMTWLKGAVVLTSLLLLVGIVVGMQYLSVRPPTSSANIPPTQPPTLPLPDKPSIVVLPFVNMSNDPEQEYFSDGITEDITADLSKISSLFVIARNSAFSYKGKSPKIQDVSREMGVRYALEGSVRKADGQVRITAQLVDGVTGGHVWSERYDRPLKDIFALQDEIRQKIVLALRVKLTLEEQERFQHAPTNNLEAYDFYLRGLNSVLRAHNETQKEANEQGRQMLEQATALDPHYAAAYAGLAFSHWLDSLHGWSPNRTQSLERAFEMAQRGVTLDDSLPLPHATLGWVYVYKRQYEQALAEAERAITLDPNYALGYAYFSLIQVHAGQPQGSLSAIEKAMRLNPRYPDDYLFALGFVYRGAGRCEEALAPLKKFVTRNPNQTPVHVNLAICYAELGKLEEAQAEVAAAQKLSPTLSLEAARQNWPYKNPADLERLLTALGKAGLK